MDRVDRLSPARPASRLKPFWKRRIFYLPPALAALANAAVYGAVTYRLATEQERLAREQASLTEEVASRREQLKTLAAERKRIAENEKTATRFWNEVVSYREKGLTEAMAEIDQLVRQSGVSRGRRTYEHADLEVGLSQVTANMLVRGSYFNLVSFINRLERSPRFFLLREVELARAAEGSDLELRCQISFFFRSEEGVAPEKAGQP